MKKLAIRPAPVLTLGLVAVLAGIVVSNGHLPTVHAGGGGGAEPVGACPPSGGWTMLFLPDNSADRNDDGYVCRKAAPPTFGKKKAPPKKSQTRGMKKKAPKKKGPKKKTPKTPKKKTGDVFIDNNRPLLD